MIQMFTQSSYSIWTGRPTNPQCHLVAVAACLEQKFILSWLVDAVERVVVPASYQWNPHEYTAAENQQTLEEW